MATTPVPFEADAEGRFFHGTKADLKVGELLTPGFTSNFEAGRQMNHVYFTGTLDAAIWGAEFARGDGPGRIYVVEPTGEYHDDPNVTDKRLPGNPTRSFRSTAPLRVVGEVEDWAGHPPEQVRAMRDSLAELHRRGEAVIYD